MEIEEDTSQAPTMTADEVLLEWLKQPGNYSRYVRADGSVPPRLGGETRTDMAREVVAKLNAAGVEGHDNPVYTNAKMMKWVRRYKKAHELVCSGANEKTVKKTFPYYYQLVDCVGSDSDLPIRTKRAIQRQRRQASSSSNGHDMSIDAYLEDGSPLSSAASLSPSPVSDFLSSSSSSSAYSQGDYVPHIPIIPTSQPDSSTLCTFSERNIINGPRRLPVPSPRPSKSAVNDDSNDNTSRANSHPTSHHQCNVMMQRMMEILYQQQQYHNQQMNRLLEQNQELLNQQSRSHRIHEMQIQASLMVSVIDRLREAGLSKDQISAHLLQLNGSVDAQQQPDQQSDQQEQPDQEEQPDQ